MARPILIVRTPKNQPKDLKSEIRTYLFDYYVLFVHDPSLKDIKFECISVNNIKDLNKEQANTLKKKFKIF